MATSNVTLTYVSEIQCMMHGFGDSSRPLFESAQLIEEIVHQQMNSMLLQAQEITSMRGIKCIGAEDLLFLMRKDKVKLQRLLKYLAVKDLKSSVTSVLDESGVAVAQPIGLPTGDFMDTIGKRRKVCRDYLLSIDDTGEFESLFKENLFDEVKHERNLRAEKTSKTLDEARYLEFAHARCASFSNKTNGMRFKEWLLKDLSDVKISGLAVEIMCYLAYETVAQLVDLALIIRRDANATSLDPVGRLMAPVCYNPYYPSVQTFKKSQDCRPQSPASIRSSPPTSPATSGVTGGGKMKATKRRQSDASLLVEGFPPLTPAEIQGAFQRYMSQHTPFAAFSRNYSAPIDKRLLCC